MTIEHQRVTQLLTFHKFALKRYRVSTLDEEDGKMIFVAAMLDLNSILQAKTQRS